MIRRVRFLLCPLSALVAGPAFVHGQVQEVRPVVPAAAAASLSNLRAAQQGFESFRRMRLPIFVGRRPAAGECDETIGRFCYWYDEDEVKPPPEPRSIRDARTRLIALLDSAGRVSPNDRWISAQRVRYLAEAERFDDAIAAARECTMLDWWCSAVQGFAYHVAGQYASSDSAYARALALMERREDCDFRDLKLLLGDAFLQRYRDQGCASRAALEERVWWLARPMLSSNGNDARTEYYSRLMMARFVQQAPSAFQMGFDSDEREMLIRYGWPTSWTREETSPYGGARAAVVGHEPTPAHPYLPMPRVLENPASSDSAEWRSKGVPPVRARYSPAYARRLVPLEHQTALFRRGDSALVAAAWSVAGDTALAAAASDGSLGAAALVLTKGEERDATIARASGATVTGALTARAPWGSMLMSLEVAAPARKTLARARYGVRGSDQPQSRVQVSDLLLFEPYDDMPRTLDDVLPHMRTSQRLKPGSRVGIYWEAYNTLPAGEQIAVSITVAPHNAGGGGWFRGALRALRLVREAKPVTVGMQDVSARGLLYTPRAVVVDLATLTPGRYLMELEIDVGGGNVVRAERAITVTRP
jgi:hypothetical protein